MTLGNQTIHHFRRSSSVRLFSRKPTGSPFYIMALFNSWTSPCRTLRKPQPPHADEESQMPDMDIKRTESLDLNGPDPSSAAGVPLLKEARMLARIEKANHESINVPQLEGTGHFPKPTWRKARKDVRGRRFPNAIAHRGYRAMYPENSMAAMRGAVDVGAVGLETDMHLSKDGVVVLSHDKDLKRCFGIDKKMIDCDWDYLKTLRSIQSPGTQSPGEPLARLSDLLAYMAQPGLEHVWVLLDIKIDNNADFVMRGIAQAISSVEPSSRPWNDRIVLGCWIPKFIPLCQKYLPGFPISHIGASVLYAEQFFAVPNCSFNMFQKALIGPFGSRFMHKVKARDRELFVWTVNTTNMMKWCIQKEVDGVITDDPKLFLDLCRSWREDELVVNPTLSQRLSALWTYVLVAVLLLFFRLKSPATFGSIPKAGQTQGRKEKLLVSGKW